MQIGPVVELAYSLGKQGRYWKQLGIQEKGEAEVRGAGSPEILLGLGFCSVQIGMPQGFQQRSRILVVRHLEEFLSPPCFSLFSES